VYAGEPHKSKDQPVDSEDPREKERGKGNIETVLNTRRKTREAPVEIIGSYSRQEGKVHRKGEAEDKSL